VKHAKAAALVVVLISAAMAAWSEQAAQSREAGKSALEQYLNPFGDNWSTAAPNPDIHLMGNFPCHRALPRELRRLTPELHDFVAALDEPIYLSECSDLLADPEIVPEEYGANLMRRRIAEFKSYHRPAKYLGYYEIAEYSTGSPAFDTLYNEHQEWFVHEAGEAPTTASLVKTKKGRLILDVTNPEFQDFIAGQARLSLDTYGMDGFLADSVFPSIEAITDSTGVPAEARANWASGWVELLSKINIAIGPDRIVLANIDEEEPEFLARILPSVDGVFLEDPLGALQIDLKGSGKLALFEHALTAAAELDRYVVNVVNTHINGIDADSTSSEQERWLARYYLAAHVIFTTGDNAMLLHYTPGLGGPQFRTSPFFEDWNLRIGQPNGPYEIVSDGVYLRRFESAYVYLNNSPVPYEVVFGECCSLLTPEGHRVARYTMPAKSGMLFVGGQVVEEIK